MEYEQAGKDADEFRNALLFQEMNGMNGPAFATMPSGMVQQIGIAFGGKRQLDEENSVTLFGVPIMVLPGATRFMMILPGDSPLGSLAEHMRAYFDAHRKLPRKIIAPDHVYAEVPEEWYLPIAAPISLKSHAHNVILMGD